jgi:hypothetical protein
MSRVGVEPTIPMFKREKTVHVLDRAATVIDVPSAFKPQNPIDSSVQNIKEGKIVPVLN